MIRFGLCGASLTALVVAMPAIAQVANAAPGASATVHQTATDATDQSQSSDDIIVTATKR